MLRELKGLLHISEIEWAYLDKVTYKEGDEVELKFMGYDDRKKMKLSRKVLLPRPERPEPKPRQESQVNPEGKRPTRRTQAFERRLRLSLNNSESPEFSGDFFIYIFVTFSISLSKKYEKNCTKLYHNSIDILSTEK